MTETAAGYEPISVHVVGDSSRTNRMRYRTVYHTVKLTADDPAQEILPDSEARVVAFVQALDDDLVLADSQGNAARGYGTVLAKANGSPWPVMDSAAVFAGNSTGTFSGGSTAYSRLTVMATYLVDVP